MRKGFQRYLMICWTPKWVERFVLADLGLPDSARDYIDWKRTTGALA